MNRTKLFALAAAPVLAASLAPSVVAPVAAAPPAQQVAPAVNPNDPSSNAYGKWGPWVTIPAGAYRQTYVYCKPNTNAVSGGGRTEAGGNSRTFVIDSYARGKSSAAESGWYVSWRNTGSASERVRASVICE